MSEQDPSPSLRKIRPMRRYLSALNDRHGYVDTIALPNMRNLSSMRIEELFVNPQLAHEYASPATDPQKWPEAMSVFAALVKYQRIVVLGDPGAGKTTLSNWLVWWLTAGLATKLPEVLENRLPICCVLREMPSHLFSLNTSIADLVLWSAQRLLGDELIEETRQALLQWVATKRYLLVLDGADEVAITHRSVVQGWVRQVHEDGACLLATSRLVGYDEVPLDCNARMRLPGDPPAPHPLTQEPAFKHTTRARVGEERLIIGGIEAPDFMQQIGEVSVNFGLEFYATKLFLLPFDDQRISAFTRNWYQLRCPNQQEAFEKTRDFLKAVAESESTQQLARTPNLLSLMAIVFRERAYLPHGRALLYKEIANAYLNTIDGQRKISAGDALSRPWEVRESWLAYIGFQMQKLRVADLGQTDAGILVEKSHVEAWLAEAMQRSNLANAQEHASEFLSWVARRSGLLLPRSETHYAFAHLSFQEYFCARHLLTQICSPAFVRGKAQDVSSKDLQAWAGIPLWHETLIYLLELTSNDRAEWLEEVLIAVLGDVENMEFGGEDHARLALKALADQHIACSSEWRNSLAARTATRSGYSGDPNLIIALADLGFAAIIGKDAHAELANISNPESIFALKIKDKNFSDGEALQRFPSLRYLCINRTKLADINALAAMPNLHILDLEDNPITDLSPLANLALLKQLRLNGTRIENIAALAACKNLRLLNLSKTKLNHIAALAQLPQLHFLYLMRTSIADWAELANLTNLRVLNMGDTAFTDSKLLANLSNLDYLLLENTPIADCTPLQTLRNLVFLNLSNTKINDIRALSQLANLYSLHLVGCQLSSLDALITIKSLRQLYLSKDQQSLGAQLQQHRPDLYICCDE